jgi:hypothetical protein
MLACPGGSPFFRSETTQWNRVIEAARLQLD